MVCNVSGLLRPCTKVFRSYGCSNGGNEIAGRRLEAGEISRGQHGSRQCVTNLPEDQLISETPIKFRARFHSIHYLNADDT